MFLPTAGEPLDVLENTYRHVARIDWPAEVRVWVLDDGDRPEVAALAAGRGFEYRVRENRGHLKKAGNLKFGYDQSSNDFIAIFDADFVPRTDYLRELMPYFVDETHRHRAVTPVLRRPQGDELAPALGRRHPGALLPVDPAVAGSRRRPPICVGTCAIYRRSALDDAGGFAQIGHSEDVHTGVKLMKAGYQLRYVPILVSKGLCPDALLGFLNQQYRWCTGSMSLLVDKSFHQNKIFSVRQRLSFWSGFLYYITTALNVFIAAWPGLIMLWVFPADIYPAQHRVAAGGDPALVLRAADRDAGLLAHGRAPGAAALLLRPRRRDLSTSSPAAPRSGWRRAAPTPGPPRSRSTVTRVMRVTVASTQVLLWAGLVDRHPDLRDRPHVGDGRASA